MGDIKCRWESLVGTLKGRGDITWKKNCKVDDNIEIDFEE